MCEDSEGVCPSPLLLHPSVKHAAQLMYVSCKCLSGNGGVSFLRKLMQHYICLEMLVHNSIGGAQCGH